MLYLAFYCATGASINLKTCTLMQHGKPPLNSSPASSKLTQAFTFLTMFTGLISNQQMAISMHFPLTITNSCIQLPELRILWENEKVRASVLLKSQEYIGISSRI